MATPFKKSISNFSGGQVDYFSTRDLSDTQYQEISNAELRLPGVVKRPQSDKQISASTGDSLYSIGTFTGNGLSVIHTEYGFGESLSISAVITSIASYSASDSGQRNKNCSLGRDATLVMASAISFSVGDYCEIFNATGATVAEEETIVGFYKVLEVISTTSIVIYLPHFENAGTPKTAAFSLTSNRYEIRNAQSYSPNVYGGMPCDIASDITSNYTNTTTSKVSGEKALMMVGLGSAQSESISINSPSPSSGFSFLSATDVKATLGLADTNDMILWFGGDFVGFGLTAGDTITYTVGSASSPATLNNNYSAIVQHVLTDMILLNTSDVVKSTGFGGRFGGVLTKTTAPVSDVKIANWDINSTPYINTYNIAGAIRIADGNFNNLENKNQWFGFIKGSRYGDSLSYGRAPNSIASRPISAYTKNSWEMMNQSIPAPTLIKMDGWGDPTYKVKNAGEIGLYVYDPKEFSTSQDLGAGTFQEHVLYPDAMMKDTFDMNDVWAATFVYDGSSESELSRNDNGIIGVSGFTTITPPEVLEAPVTYLDASQDELVAKVVGYASTNSPVDSRENTLIHISSLTDGSAGAHQTLSVGDYIKAGSEVMCITSIADHSSSNAYCVYGVHRGVDGTTPIDLLPTGSGSGDDGLEIYHVDQNQSARAINVVLCTGNNTSSRIDYVQSGTKFYVEAAKSLGSLANMRLVLNITYSATGSGTSTIVVSKQVVNSSEAHYLRLNVVCTKKSSNAIAFEDIVAAINNEPVVSSNVAISQQNPINDYCTAYIASGVTAGDEATTSMGAKYFGDTTVGSSVDGVNVDGLNKRITGFNLYWKPKNEVDYYLVNYFDIEKGWSNI